MARRPASGNTPSPATQLSLFDRDEDEPDEPATITAEPADQVDDEEPVPPVPADDDTNGNRGTRLARLNALAKVLRPARMGMALRGIDDNARSRRAWIGTLHELAAFMACSTKTARRAVAELVDAGLLSQEPAGSRAIHSPHRRDAAGYDSEALFEWMIVWPELAEAVKRRGGNAGTSVRPAGQSVPPAGQSVPPAGQSGQRTSIRASTHPPPPPADDGWAEAEAVVSKVLTRWQSAIATARDRGLDPADVLGIVDFWEAVPKLGPGALHERLVQAHARWHPWEGWAAELDERRERLAWGIRRAERMDDGDVAALAEWILQHYADDDERAARFHDDFRGGWPARDAKTIKRVAFAITARDDARSESEVVRSA